MGGGGWEAAGPVAHFERRESPAQRRQIPTSAFVFPIRCRSRGSIGTQTMRVMALERAVLVERGKDELEDLEMNAQEQIDSYISGLAQPKREELQTLHRVILKISPNCKLWYLDGKNEEGKIISNPNIGYGLHPRSYANGETREFYRVGLSANSTGISIYMMGVENKKYLHETYGKRIGRADITGYCVKFRNLRDVDLNIIEEMVTNHMSEGSARGS